jgi:hypothetical protein
MVSINLPGKIGKLRERWLMGEVLMMDYLRWQDIAICKETCRRQVS